MTARGVEEELREALKRLKNIAWHIGEELQPEPDDDQWHAHIVELREALDQADAAVAPPMDAREQMIDRALESCSAASTRTTLARSAPAAAPPISSAGFQGVLDDLGKGPTAANEAAPPVEAQPGAHVCREDAELRAEIVRLQNIAIAVMTRLPSMTGSHYVNIVVRANGQDHVYQADWLTAVQRGDWRALLADPEPLARPSKAPPRGQP